MKRPSKSFKLIVEGREWDPPDGRRRECKLLLEESLPIGESS